jgi:hypothetical protein
MIDEAGNEGAVQSYFRRNTEMVAGEEFVRLDIS